MAFEVIEKYERFVEKQGEIYIAVYPTGQSRISEWAVKSFGLKDAISVKFLYDEDNKRIGFSFSGQDADGKDRRCFASPGRGIMLSTAGLFKRIGLDISKTTHLPIKQDETTGIVYFEA